MDEIELLIDPKDLISERQRDHSFNGQQAPLENPNHGNGIELAIGKELSP